MLWDALCHAYGANLQIKLLIRESCLLYVTLTEFILLDSKFIDLKTENFILQSQNEVFIFFIKLKLLFNTIRQK